MSNTATAGVASIYVNVNGQHFRTKSIDRVARRLHGPNARVVVQERRNGLMHGFFIMPSRSNPSVYEVRERFREEDPEVARIMRAHMKAVLQQQETGDAPETGGAAGAVERDRTAGARVASVYA